MVSDIEQRQLVYLNSKDDKDLKKLGQYFTDSSISDYMASLIDPIGNGDTIRILDAEAGVGILTCSVVFRLLGLGYRNIHAVLYEIDEKAVEILRNNLEALSTTVTDRGAIFTFDIRNDDFVITRPDRTEEPFHLSSINPPYFKYDANNSPYATKSTRDLFHGNPNIYASFMAVVSACLRPDGQMVAIVPRSFTNGLYFKYFRHYMNYRMSLECVHVFNSRSKVFKRKKVLKKNVICKYVRRRQETNIETCQE